jgi:hypothetical protein
MVFLLRVIISETTRRLAGTRCAIDRCVGVWRELTLGKLDANPHEVLDGIEPAGFNLLGVSAEHAARVAEFSWGYLP